MKGLAGALLLAALVLAAAWAAPETASASQRVLLRTDDGVVLAGTWYEPVNRPAPAVVFVHMLRRSRRDWDSMASRLAAGGIGALTFDLRGHGESPGSADEHSAMVRDVNAARRYLGTRADVLPDHVSLVGASLGASLAALSAADDSSVRTLGLLSPALDYRGLRIDAAMRKVGTRPVLLVASDDDPYALRSARDLQKANVRTRELLILNGAGHGTNMLFRSPDLGAALLDWLRRTLL
jgi:pimeloyl-ACP methyl ester carboxylesterase